MLKSKKTKINLIILLLGLSITLGLIREYDNKNVQAVETAQKEISTIIEKDETVFELKENEIVGHIEIPGILSITPLIYHENDNNLDLGITIDENLVLPGKAGLTALAGHRETFFKELENVKKNQIISIYFLDTNYYYMITKIDTVDQYDRDSVYIKTNKDMLVLITCYPFSRWTEPNERFIVFAERLK